MKSKGEIQRKDRKIKEIERLEEWGKQRPSREKGKQKIKSNDMEEGDHTSQP